jgi:hypothetical protein
MYLNLLLLFQISYNTFKKVSKDNLKMHTFTEMSPT